MTDSWSGVILRQSVKSSYVFKERLGHGIHGVVHLAVERSTGLLRAVKKIRKKPGLDIGRFKRELEVLVNFRHPHIVKVYEAFEDCNALYIIMEYCRGGDLCDRLETEGGFAESAAAYFMRQALGAVSMCHDNGIMHRDIKLENFLFTDHDVRSPLKLADFGLCRYFQDKSDPPSLVGTINYLAPEVLAMKYDHSADLWSLGILLYMLLVDNFPFGRLAKTEADVLKEIKVGKIDFPVTGTVPSPLAQDLIRSLCHLDPAQRLSARDALKHPWITGLSPAPLQFIPFILGSHLAELDACPAELLIAGDNDEGPPTAQRGPSVHYDDGNLAAAFVPSRIVCSIKSDYAVTFRAPSFSYGDRPTVQEFVKLIEASEDEANLCSRRQWSSPATEDARNGSCKLSSLREFAKKQKERVLLPPQKNHRNNGKSGSSPTLTPFRERSMAIAHQLRNEVSAVSSASSVSVRASNSANFEGRPVHVPRRPWASATNLAAKREAGSSETHFCCGMWELCSQHSKKCPVAVGAYARPVADAEGLSSCNCDLCSTLRRVSTTIYRLGVTSMASASGLGRRLVDRWKAFQHLSRTEKNVLSMIARQMDTSELTYFGCLYEFLDCERRGDVGVEPLARAVSFLCEAQSLVCHHPFPQHAVQQHSVQQQQPQAATPPVKIATPPVSPQTVPVVAAEEDDSYANDLAMVVGNDLKICEKCTPQDAFARYVQLLADLRSLLSVHIDLNQNGKIEVDEFCASCMDQLLVLKPIASKILFNSLNVHQKTTLTLADFKVALGSTADSERNLIEHVDSDGDGLIEETDLEALLSGSAACLSRGSETRLCEESKETILDSSPRDSLDFRHLMPKLSSAR